jgi:hypothetical protein
VRKREELATVPSCWNKAADDEMVFVLLGRDVAAPDTIRNWVANRITKGKNNITDPEIKEALLCADIMEREQRAGRELT